MPEEYFDVAWINFSKVILHGRVTVGRDEYGVRQERDIEQVLTDDQRAQLEDLNFRHQRERDALLKSFVDLTEAKGGADS